METGSLGSFRLVLISVHPWWKAPMVLAEYLRKIPVCDWRDQLCVLYGMDIWFNRVPLVRTVIVAHLVLWILRRERRGY